MKAKALNERSLPGRSSRSALVRLLALLSFKHGIDAFRPGRRTNQNVADMGISPAATPYISALSLISGILLLLPQTFFAANLLNAMIIPIIMALSLRTGNVRIALLEILFLALPLLLIWLKYPFKS